MKWIQSKAFSIHTDDPRHRVITDESEFWEAIRWLEKQSLVAADTETSGLAWNKHARICGVSMSAWAADGNTVQSFYFPCRHQTGEGQLQAQLVMDGVRIILENPAIAKVLHNIIFDEHMFMREGIRIKGVRRDTMIEAHLYNENAPLALKDRAFRDLGESLAHKHENSLGAEVARLAKEAGSKIEEFRDATGYARVNIMLAGVYACYDTEFTLRLASFYDKENVTSFFKGIYATEMELTKVIFEMEENGMPIDVPYLKWLSDETAKDMERLKPLIFSQAGGYEFNPNSDEEVLHLLTHKLNLGSKLWKKTKGGVFAVDAEVLEHFAVDHPVLATLKSYRDASKINSTYTQSIIERIGPDGLLHGRFKQVGTSTGRLSAEQPNMQNFLSDSDERAFKHSGKHLKDGGADPWSVKRAFVNISPDICRVSHDYSQIELRVLAKYSEDPVLVSAYLNGEDLHDRTALEAGVDRRKAKVLNFGLSYCLSAKGYARQAAVSEEQAELDMQRFFERYAGIAKFRDKFWAECRIKNPPGFLNMFGRPRRIIGMHEQDSYRRGRAERQAIGALIQGTAAELTKQSLVRIWQWEQLNRAGLKLVSTIHDEISYDAPKKLVKDLLKVTVPAMESFPQFSPVPILVSADYFDSNWSEKKKLPEEWIDHVWKKGEDKCLSVTQ